MTKWRCAVWVWCGATNISHCQTRHCRRLMQINAQSIHIVWHIEKWLCNLIVPAPVRLTFGVAYTIFISNPVHLMPVRLSGSSACIVLHTPISIHAKHARARARAYIVCELCFAFHFQFHFHFHSSWIYIFFICIDQRIRALRNVVLWHQKNYNKLKRKD